MIPGPVNGGAQPLQLPPVDPANPIPLMDLPRWWGVARERMADGREIVLLCVREPGFTKTFPLARDQALALAEVIRSEADQITSLILPPAGGTLPPMGGPR